MKRWCLRVIKKTKTVFMGGNFMKVFEPAWKPASARAVNAILSF
jgi:hypothetical protein